MDKEEQYEKQNEDPSLHIDRRRFTSDNSTINDLEKHFPQSHTSNDDAKARETYSRREAQFKTEKVASLGARRKYYELWLKRNGLIEHDPAQIEKQRLAQLETQRVAQAQRQADAEMQRAAQAQRQASQQPSSTRPSDSTSSGAGCILPVIGIVAFIALLPFLLQALAVLIPIAVGGSIIVVIISAIFGKK